MGKTVNNLVGGALLGAFVSGAQGCETPQNHSGTDTAPAESSAYAGTGAKVTAISADMSRRAVQDGFKAIHGALKKIESENPNKYPVIGEVSDTTVVVPFSVIPDDLKITADDYWEFVSSHLGSVDDVATITRKGALIRHQKTDELGPLSLNTSIQRGFGECDDFALLAHQGLVAIDQNLNPRGIKIDFQDGAKHAVAIYTKDDQLRVMDQGHDTDYKTFMGTMEKKHGGIQGRWKSTGEKTDQPWLV
jgi:hypothetical protein